MQVSDTKVETSRVRVPEPTFMESANSRRAGHTRAFFSEYSVTILAAIVALIVWEIVVDVLRVPTFLIPAPSAVVAALIRFWSLLMQDTWVTLIETVIGFLAGSMVGLLLAVGVVFSPTFEKIVYPPAIVTQVVPKLAVAPLFVIWFGTGLLPKIMITIVMCLFPVLINAVSGMRDVDPRMIDLMHSVNANRWQIFCKVQFPNSTPHIFAGLKIGITLAVVGAVVGEWLGANSGLGHEIVMANSQLRSDLLFAALVLLSAIGIALFGITMALEALLIPRQRQVRVAGNLG